MQKLLPTENKNLPKLRFPEFQNAGAWQEKELNKIFDLRNGYTPSKSKLKYWINGTIPWFRMEDIRKNGRILDDSIQHITKEAVKTGKLFPANSIIIATTATIGEHALITVDSLANQRFTFLIKKVNCINIKFFFYYCYILGNWCRNNTNKGGFESVQMDRFRKIKIPIPQKKEQQKIAEVLTLWDKSIDKQNALIQQKQNLKKGLIQQLFSQQLRFKDDNGDDYPNWQEKSLGSILDYEQPTKYIVNSTEYNNNNKIPVLTAGKNFILGYTNETDGIFFNTPVIIFDDFTTSNHFVNFNFKVKSSAMKILKLKPDINANLKFVYEFMQKIKFPLGEHKRYWISEYQFMDIAFPCLAEQQKIANLLSLIDQEIEGLKQKLQIFKQQKKGLMQQLLTIKTRV